MCSSYGIGFGFHRRGDGKEGLDEGILWGVKNSPLFYSYLKGRDQ